MYILLKGFGLTLALHYKHVKYGVHEQQHEAGYDALLTAQVFLALTGEMIGCGRKYPEETNSSSMFLHID